ncbi:MAG TPA: hypothetical protein PKW21_12840 [Rhabdaerophilum sp.]|nr:hypothetical protein [Rhabdaerophilum sp.]
MLRKLAWVFSVLVLVGLPDRLARAEDNPGGWGEQKVSPTPTDKDRLYVSAKASGPEVDPGKLYLVQIDLTRIISEEEFSKSNLFYKKQSFSSQSLSFHSTLPNGSEEIKADKVNHLINVFSVTKSADGISEFFNEVRTIRFVAEGRNIRYVAPFWMTQTDVSPSTAAKAFFAFTGVFVKAIPVLRLPTNPTTTLIKAIPDLEKPYETLVDVFDKAKKTMLKAYALREKTQFDTKTASIAISAKEIKSFNEVYGQADQSIKDGLLATIRAYADRKDGANLVSCPLLARSLREDYKYDEQNQAFVMGYVGQTRAFADSGDTDKKVSVMLDCIAKPEFMRRVLNYPYNRDEPDVAIDETDIDNFKYSWAEALPTVNSNYATGLTIGGTDGIAFVRSRSLPMIRVRQIGVDVLPLGWFLAGDWSEQKPEDLLKTLNDKGYGVFGCAGDTVSGPAATIIALPATPKPGAAAYTASEALKLAMGYTLSAGRPTVGRVTITRPMATEVSERVCRDGLKPFAKVP